MAAIESSGPELSDGTSGDSGNEDGEELCENSSGEENLNYGVGGAPSGLKYSDKDSNP